MNQNELAAQTLTHYLEHINRKKVLMDEIKVLNAELKTCDPKIQDIVRAQGGTMTFSGRTISYTEKPKLCGINDEVIAQSYVQFVQNRHSYTVTADDGHAFANTLGMARKATHASNKQIGKITVK